MNADKSLIGMESSAVALVHYWMLGMTGGERVCEAICDLLGPVDIHCLLADPESLSETLRKSSFKTSFIQRLPMAQKYYRYYVGLFPLAVESLDLRSYDLVISNDASVMKGVLTAPETCHVCNCLSPVRYAWNMFQDYREGLGPLKRLFMDAAMHYIRLFDHAAASRVDYFTAISETVKRRIRKYYGRDSTVIYPPVDVDRFRPADKIDDYYLFVGRLVDYKKADLAVEALNHTGRRLVVAGDGPQMSYVKSIAKKNVEILGKVGDEELASLYRHCKALIFPAEEDFGIVPVECQAAGRPVIAFGKGGACETIVEGETGLFFESQTPQSLIDAIDRFEKTADGFDPQRIRRHSEYFSRQRFQQEFMEFLSSCLAERRAAHTSGGMDRPMRRVSR
jgi:glycosyltransferase involved in cell wall biosynthesis